MARDQSLTEVSPSTRKSPAEGVELGVLGPLSVRVGGLAKVIKPLMQRRLLGLLALQPNQMVRHEEVVGLLWEDDPPESWHNLIHGYVSRLRKVVTWPDGDSRVDIVATRGAYSLEIGSSRLDLLRFDELRCIDGESAPVALARLTEALACWRAPVLSELGPGLSEHPAAVALTQRWVETGLEFADLAMSVRQPELAVEPLEALAQVVPFHESVHAKLMLALASSGRQANALKLYDDLRNRLADELGVEPSPEVQRVHLRVLRCDVPQPADVVALRQSPAPSMQPCTLPRDVTDFTGRTAELRELLTIGPTDTAAPVIAIDGMAGVGKTALAVHAAHHLADRYPDGQLFVDLRGHTLGHRPLATAAALDKLLRGLGVPGEQIPGETDDRVALWRSTLARRRVLVVLDNASSAAQVQPLLPTGPGCFALITSRRRLSMDGVRALSLDVLPAEDAHALFRRVVGERADSERAAVEGIVALCGRLPMAIRIAAARLHHRPTWTVGYLGKRLRRERNRLAELRNGDVGVGAAFALSYRQLTAVQRRMFRLLGLQSGTHVDAFAAAALAGTTPARAERLLECLVDMHLLQQPEPGRYRFHDLLREYAAETARSTDPRSAREEAFARLLDYYLHTADSVLHVVNPGRRAIPLVLSGPEPIRPDIVDVEGALRWLDAEQGNLTAAVVAAAEQGRHEHVWQLTRAMWWLFRERGHLQDWLQTHRLALSSARALGDRWAEAETLKNLGLAYWYAADDERAVAHLHDALALDRALGDRPGEGKTHSLLGYIHDLAGEHRLAFVHQHLALCLYREAEDEWGINRALSGLGNVYRKLGREKQARDHLERALCMSDRAGDGWGASLAHIGLAYINEQQGEPGSAYHHFRSALTYGRQTGDRLIQALTHAGLGRLDQQADRAGDAGAHHQEALSLARELGNRDLGTEALGGLAAAQRSET